MNLFFEDELSGVSVLNKNMLCGAITGSIYKSTLGVVPAGVGFLLGGAFIGSMTKVVDNLNQRGVVAFEMKFWLMFLLFDLYCFLLITDLSYDY